MYGVLEKQFRNYYKKAASSKGNTGENLLSLLESRKISDDAATAIFTADKASSLTLNVTGFIEQTGNISADKATSVTVTTGAEDQTAIDIDAAKAETVSITAGADADFADAAAAATSDFSGAKVITASSTGATILPALAAANSVTLSGAGADAAITTGNLGAATLAYDVTATASGLKSGVTLGTVQTAGAATVDFSGATGANTVGAITTTGAATVTAGAGAATIGKIDASAVTVDLTASSTSTTFNDGAGAVDIVSGSTVDITSNAIQATDVDIDGDKKSLTVTATGSLGDDRLDITNSNDADDFTGFTVSGDLGLGSDTVTIAVLDTDATTGTPTVTTDVTGLKNVDTVTITVADTDAGDNVVIKGSKDTNTTESVSFALNEVLTELSMTDIGAITYNTTLSVNTDAISGQTIAFTGTTGTYTVTLTGTDGADTFDAEDFTTAGANTSTLTINGGKGADTITLSAMADTVVFAGSTAAANGSDVITDHQVADVYNFASVLTGGTLANAGDITLASTTALATEGSSIAVATNKVYVAEVAAEATIDSVADLVTALADGGVMDAVDVAASAEAIIVVGGADDDTTHYIYGINNDATAAVAASEVALLATVTTDLAAGVDTLTSANFVF